MWTRGVLFSMASALALCAMPAAAQDYSPYVTPGFGARDNAPEVVIVRPPYVPRSYSYGPAGAPVINAAISRPVRFDDLDLRTAWGVRALHARIRHTATALCNRINALYPASVDAADGAWPVDTHCIRRATAEAMDQADDAIRAARSGYNP